MYLSFLFVFEVGSLLCATAVNSVMLIIGRAIAGCGAAGLFSGALVIIGNHVVLRQRPSKLNHLLLKALPRLMARNGAGFVDRVEANNQQYGLV